MGKPEASLREEDQNPFSQCNSRYISLEGSDPPARCCGLRRRTVYIISGVITTVILAIIIIPSIVLTLIYPTITYSGDLPKHAYGQGVIACGSTLMGNDSVMIAQSVFDRGRKGNSSSVCGHKIRAQGSATNGGSGSNRVIVKSGKMSLTVVGYCPGCQDGDLIVTDEAYGTLTPSVEESDGTWVKWHWLVPIPKLHI